MEKDEVSNSLHTRDNWSIYFYESKWANFGNTFHVSDINERVSKNNNKQQWDTND